MKRGSINYRLYVKYNSDNPAKVRALEDLLNKGYNGLADSVVSKWFDKMLSQAKEREGQIKVNGYGETSYL